ncbi:Hypothetical predicted protein, partial [Mytilus galloprovincialis]
MKLRRLAFLLCIIIDLEMIYGEEDSAIKVPEITNAPNLEKAHLYRILLNHSTSRGILVLNALQLQLIPYTVIMLILPIRLRMDVFLYGFLLLTLSKCVVSKSPNIVFIVADDLGWNDVGFHNPAIISPNIDYLAKNGMILNNSYVQPVCSPSRNAFLSGFYPFKSGLQNFVILPQAPSCAPLNRTFLPQKLKELGYATHMIGKWHLGMCKWECTPTYRGFDTFYGYYNGQEDYYNYTVLNGSDFRDNKEPIRPNEYSTYAYARRADKIITQHNKSQPMFLYLPFQSVHEPIQVPEIYENMYQDIKNEGRRKYSGMVTAMDDAIGNVTESLKRNGMFEDTLIIFTADNGGWTTFSGNNYPLRGGKATVYEGGTRASAFVYGSGLQKPYTVFDGMIHAVDWMPTILSAAGGGQVSGIDGVDLWPSISEGVPSSLRSEFIYNLDDSLVPIVGHAAIRMGNYKLIEGFAGAYNGWYPVPENEEDSEIEEPKVDYYQLYNLRDDPNEHNNLHIKEHSMLKKMKERLDEYRKYIFSSMFSRLTSVFASLIRFERSRYTFKCSGRTITAVKIKGMLRKRSRRLIKSTPLTWSKGPTIMFSKAKAPLLRMDVILYVPLLLSLFECVVSKSPNIVFIVADDLGWNDVGFHNPDIISPNIDYLAKNGMILNNSYVQPVCSPSRSAFLSGFYPFKSGLQNNVIGPAEAACPPLNQTLLPQKLKELGYATHMIGKWHLGMCKWECTPTYRGFDTFYGYYNGKEDYYNYTIANGSDFRDNKVPIRPNEYSTYAYARRADIIITQQNKSQPMFLYLPFQSVHQPIQVSCYCDAEKNPRTLRRHKPSPFTLILQGHEDLVYSAFTIIVKTRETLTIIKIQVFRIAIIYLCLTDNCVFEYTMRLFTFLIHVVRIMYILINDNSATGAMFCLAIK